MSQAKQMLDSYPGSFGFDADQLAAAISALHDCAQVCTACADACLAEDGVADLVRCIRLDADCADLCETTARILSRQTAYDSAVTRVTLVACVQACQTCAEECETHAEHMGMKHCRLCAEACRRCEEACQGLITAIDS